MTTYTTITSSLSVNDPQFLSGARDYCKISHKSIASAVRCQERFQSRCRKANGNNTRLDIHLIAEDDGNLRNLNCTELEQIIDAEIAMDARR